MKPDRPTAAEIELAKWLQSLPCPSVPMVPELDRAYSRLCKFGLARPVFINGRFGYVAKAPRKSTK